MADLGLGGIDLGIDVAVVHPLDGLHMDALPHRAGTGIDRDVGRLRRRLTAVARRIGVHHVMFGRQQAHLRCRDATDSDAENSCTHHVTSRRLTAKLP
ncbi:hypothetical protein SDC9_173054 [bioreactor metagenome]|uniref:Uncharacterized protein n=1 Tax=bioreactor metagenome TaxID=1076179 RepID=A0A645GI33_9ZZZZ